MKSAKVVGMLVLGVWLLLWGLLSVLQITIPIQHIVLGSLAIIAGVLVLLGL